MSSTSSSSMAEADLKVTKMVIKVDLQCCKCYKKIKKVLCRYPQLRDQIYDEKDNRVFIRVVCCSPECIMEKIICKAGDTVESIEIMPDKPKEPEKPKPAEKPKEPEKPKPVEKPKDPPKREKPKVVTVEPPKEAANPRLQSLPSLPLRQRHRTPWYRDSRCCHRRNKSQCTLSGYAAAAAKGGPSYCRRGPTCHDGCGRPAYECRGTNKGYYMSSCDEYLSEENASGCRVM
ncbi:hypothetical protein MLD38_036732 [Melastoma candidum]|uniref:Uncharacterized protein n=1 Tax=Melastoma candidum TaxID=119954 RepID=A0ACB9LLA4_9MYRT|nr:hypothetical protein MLD38_036732 [Melastoma candidum]